MIAFQPLQFTPQVMAQYGALFAACFPTTNKFSGDYLQWLYVDNPDGRAVGFDAWDGERLAAHYVCIPARANVNGLPAQLLLSLNTATHPDYQGKGLFTKLAEMTYDAGRAAGYDGVYGVANANSTPGFLRKLEFQLVRPLQALIGVGSLGTKPSAAPLSFERLWTTASLRWRCANPANPVRARQRGASWQFEAPALGVWAPAYAELPATGELAASAISPPPKTISPLRLFIGLTPANAGGLGRYGSIPNRLRPSPLNLIYRSFAPAFTRLDAHAINFTFLDFDAY